MLEHFLRMRGPVPSFQSSAQLVEFGLSLCACTCLHIVQVTKNILYEKVGVILIGFEGNSVTKSKETRV